LFERAPVSSDRGSAYSSAVAGVSRFYDYRSAIGKYFRHARGDFGRIIAHANDRVCSDFRSVLDHDFESIATRLFAHFGPDGDVAADDLLKSRAECSKHVP